MNSAYNGTTGRFAHRWSLTACHIYVWAWYAVATAAGAAVAFAVYDRYHSTLANWTIQGIPAYPLFLAAVADVVGTLVIWISAIIVNNSSLYDAYWSIYPALIVIYWLIASLVDKKDVPKARLALITLSIWTWAARLTRNWVVGWQGGLAHEDFRYVNIRDSFERKGLPKWTYWLGGCLVGIMIVPTIFVYIAMIPAFLAMYSSVTEVHAKEFNVLDVIAMCVCIGAATIQFFADEQMRTWRKKEHPPDECMHEGLWRYSRHPNYFGEQLFWLGLYIHALASRNEYWWSGLGFVLIVALFTFASVPLMEERMLERRPNYRYVQRTTSMMIPFFPFRQSQHEAPQTISGPVSPESTSEATSETPCLRRE